MMVREHLRNSATKDRLTGAVLALLLQIGFIAAFLHALPLMTPPKQLARELTFFLPRLAPAPAPVKTEATPRATSLPVFVPPPLFSLPASPAPSAPSTALQNFGQALFGCAPETYSSLTPQQKAACLRPGEGVAIQEFPNLMGAPSHVKDNARWANALAHEKSPLLLPGAKQDGLGLGVFSVKLVGVKIIGVDESGSVTGLLGREGLPESWPSYDVKTYAPEDFYKIAPADDAWNKAHAPAKSISVHPQ
jgi:hypothetical protein